MKSSCEEHLSIFTQSSSFVACALLRGSEGLQHSTASGCLSLFVKALINSSRPQIQMRQLSPPSF